MAWTFIMLKLRISFRFRHKLDISPPHRERAEAAAAHGTTTRAAAPCPTLPTAAAANSAAAAQPVGRRGSREEERVHAGVRGGARRQAELRRSPHGRVTEVVEG